MQYYRTSADDGRLIARDGDDAVDLTSADDALASFRDLAAAAADAGTGLDDVAAELVDEADEVPVDGLEDDLARPVVPDEVWAAGVTYQVSEEAREGESSMADVYVDVYDAERPELFFKATPSRTVGPGDSVGVRADSEWNAPEPELAVVLSGEEVVGYTIGNDVSSRSIEGANPLYLPQAKIYDRSCAVGPCVASAESIDDPHDLEMSMAISRDGEQVFEDAVSTGDMIRTCEELVSFYTRHNVVPEVSVLMTGTSIVPPDEFDLQEGDEVAIDIEGIGTLENDVVSV